MHACRLFCDPINLSLRPWAGGGLSVPEKFSASGKNFLSGLFRKREGKALEQLKAKRYHEKYLSKCLELYLIGVEFSKEKRNIVDFSWERV